MIYDQQNEMLRFIWRNESIRFHFFGRVRLGNQTDSRPMGDGVGRSGRSSCPKALVGAARRPRPDERCAASHLEGRSEAGNPCVAALERSLRQAPGRLSRPLRGAPERGFREIQGAKKLRRSALKSLKQLVHVNLCATPTEGS